MITAGESPTGRDRIALMAFMADPRPEIALRSNPLLVALRASIVAAKPGRTTLSFEPDAAFIQGGGVVQGGIVTTMLDFAMAFAGMTQSQPGDAMSTVGLNVQFLRALPAGTCRVEGWTERRGRSLIFLRGEAFREDGDCAASASATMAVTSR